MKRGLLAGFSEILQEIWSSWLVFQKFFKKIWGSGSVSWLGVSSTLWFSSTFSLVLTSFPEEFALKLSQGVRISTRHLA
ncbi:hypothetical protein VNO77_40251 [Canavalia gladiata]|uniref:Uncharacterized protein n=1 Tax=Canavalia gladiata TaxID=3824 RepID=A0AAN9PPH9_CANGL